MIGICSLRNVRILFQSGLVGGCGEPCVLTDSILEAVDKTLGLWWLPWGYVVMGWEGCFVFLNFFQTVFVPLRAFPIDVQVKSLPPPGWKPVPPVVSSLVGAELALVSRAAHIQTAGSLGGLVSARVPGAPELIHLRGDARSLASQVFSTPISTEFSGSEFRRGSLGRPALRVCAPSSLAWLSQRPCGGGSQAPSHQPARTRGSGLTQPPSCPPGITDSFVSEARGLDLREAPSCFVLSPKPYQPKQSRDLPR